MDPFHSFFLQPSKYVSNAHVFKILSKVVFRLLLLWFLWKTRIGWHCDWYHFVNIFSLSKYMGYWMGWSPKPGCLSLIFGKLCCNFFYDRYGCIYARRYDDWIVWNARTWFPKIGTILIFLNTIVESGRKHSLDPEFTLFCINLMLKKPCLKFPKSAAWIFGLKMTPCPPPLVLFRKFIRFGAAILPIGVGL